jgi:hypothetical protein
LIELRPFESTDEFRDTFQHTLNRRRRLSEPEINEVISRSKRLAKKNAHKKYKETLIAEKLEQDRENRELEKENKRSKARIRYKERKCSKKKGFDPFRKRQLSAPH